MVVSDIDRLIEIELKVYSGSLYEEADFFLNRIRLAPEFCWVVENQQGVQGYLISYPWAYLELPQLNLVVDRLPKYADCWFIHDCAIMPDCRGQGLAERLLHQAENVAVKAGLHFSGLIALSSAVAYWQNKGYDLVMLSDSVLIKKLSGYGAGACYMVKKLPNIFSD